MGSLPFQVLPRIKDLSSHQIEFLDQNLRTHQDLFSKTSLLLTELSQQCSENETVLLNLQKSFTKLVVSWISHSFKAKFSLKNITVLLENLSLLTSQSGIGSRRIQKILGYELPLVVKQLQRIENIRNYVDTALQLEALVGDLEDAVFSVGNFHARNVLSSKDFRTKHERLVQAIKIMNEIENLLVDKVKPHPQWRHLLQSVDVRVDKSLAVVRHQVLADHRALLASLGWPPKLSTLKADGGEVFGIPNPLVLMEGDKRESYSQSFLALCALQHLQTRREDRQINIFGQKNNCMRLWAIDELVSPIASRTEYHFLKWSDHPELMFALVYKITRDFIIGVDDVLQPLIDKARLVSYSAKEAWVSAMVQMLSGFLAKSIFPYLADRYKEKQTRSEVVSSWIHLIDHMVAFDKRIKSLVSAEAGLLFEESERLDGLSTDLSALSIFCNKPEWLKIWAKIELKDGWKKLKVELKEERAWLINKKPESAAKTATESEPFLLSSREDYKAPLIAELAVNIAWEMIERCETLPSIEARIKFIRSSAATFFWYFFKVLVFRCKNTEFIVDYPDYTLIKVSGVINTAKYVKSKLQEWSDEVKFLEMKICEEKNMKGNSSDLIKSSFFAEEIKSLSELETNWIMDIISALLCDFETLSQTYWENLQHKKFFEQVQEVQTSSRVSEAEYLAVSVDIVHALDTMKSKLHDLRMNLNPRDFLDLWRSVAEGLDHFISRTFFNMDTAPFSREVISQFGADMKALFFVFQPLCVRPEAFFPCIRETLKLLNMSKLESDHLQVVISKSRNLKHCLRSCGFSLLSFVQVDKVLKNRKFSA